MNKVWIAAALALTVVACGDDDSGGGSSNTSGTPSSATSGPSGSGGNATTGSGGSGGETGPGGAGGGVGPGGAGGRAEGLPFGAVCTTNEECSTHYCIDFNNKGMHCTLPCTTPADCAPYADKCGGMGYCPVP